MSALVTVSKGISPHVQGWTYEVQFEVNNSMDIPIGIGPSASLYVMDVAGKPLSSTGLRFVYVRGPWQRKFLPTC